MMTKIGNMQKIMISLDIFAEEKSFLNWPENQALVSGHPVYTSFVSILFERFKKIGADVLFKLNDIL